LALNSAENRLRVLMVIRPLYRRIHLTKLSQEAGPPLIRIGIQVNIVHIEYQILHIQNGEMRAWLGHHHLEPVPRRLPLLLPL